MELILGDIRCFAGKHTIAIRPLTILVGENSSGKSTFLSVVAGVILDTVTRGRREVKLLAYLEQRAPGGDWDRRGP